MLSVIYNDIWLLIVTAFYPFMRRSCWGIYYVFRLFFPLIPSFFYASGHSDLVQQMSPDVLSSCSGSTGFLCLLCGIYWASQRLWVSLVCFMSASLSTLQLLTRLLFPFLSQGTCEKEMKRAFECLCNSWYLERGDQGLVFAFLKCSFLFSSQYKVMHWEIVLLFFLSNFVNLGNYWSV